MRKIRLERKIAKTFDLAKPILKIKGISKFYISYNEKFHFFVNFNYRVSRIEYGLLLTSKLDEADFFAKSGIGTNSSNLRECIPFSSLSNHEFVIDKLSKFLQEFDELSKDSIRSIIKTKRNEFRNLVHNKIEVLGFKRDYNTWELVKGEYKIVLHLAKNRFADEYDFYCWVYEKNANLKQYSHAFVDERLVSKKTKRYFFDWILDEKLFFDCLDVFINDIITPLLNDDIEKLKYFRPKK